MIHNKHIGEDREFLFNKQTCKKRDFTINKLFTLAGITPSIVDNLTKGKLEIPN